MARKTLKYEQFFDWSEACDAAVERDKPIIAGVMSYGANDGEDYLDIQKVFPSRQMYAVARVYSNGEREVFNRHIIGEETS